MCCTLPRGADTSRARLHLAQLQVTTYNADARRTSFDGLSEAIKMLGHGCSRKFAELLDFIKTQASELSRRLPDGVPMLTESGVVELSRPQCCSLLAHMFLCSPWTPSEAAAGVDYLPPSFLPLFSSLAQQEVAKLRCHLNYWVRMQAAGGPPAEGSVYFRRVQASSDDVPAWGLCNEPLGRFTIHPTGGIEEAHGALHADFANEYLGGGALCGGCVQEEILFSVAPEHCVGMLLCSAMKPLEAILISGAEVFSAIKGYAFDLRFLGDHVDKWPRAEHAADESEHISAPGAGLGTGGAGAGCALATASGGVHPGTILRSVVAIDALPFGRRRRAVDQLSERILNRELAKAWVGFRVDEAECSKSSFPDVATGNWGCGAFGGFVPIKAIVQWLAASMCGRGVQYYSFGNALASTELQACIDALTARGSEVTVSATRHSVCGQAVRLTAFQCVPHRLASSIEPFADCVTRCRTMVAGKAFMTPWLLPSTQGRGADANADVFPVPMRQRLAPSCRLPSRLLAWCATATANSSRRQIMCVLVE